MTGGAPLLVGERDGRAGITASLVKALLAEQAPWWSDLPVEPVPVDGWDNRTYRLGDELTVRLPTAEWYVASVEKESRWLPVLAPRLPLSIPEPVFTGRPGAGYPYPWSVRRWLPGRPASSDLRDVEHFAENVAAFLVALRGVDATGGPVAGEHSFHRGQSPSWYDDETRTALATAGGVDVARATAVWKDALVTTWQGPDVWFHGDVAVGNLLVRDERLAAVIDFGTCGVGDPACDLVLAWTFLAGPARRRFQRIVGLDDGTWARARGWALWKALISLDGEDAAFHRHVIAEVLADQA